MLSSLLLTTGRFASKRRGRMPSRRCRANKKEARSTASRRKRRTLFQFKILPHLRGIFAANVTEEQPPSHQDQPSLARKSHGTGRRRNPIARLRKQRRDLAGRQHAAGPQSAAAGPVPHPSSRLSAGCPPVSSSWFCLELAFSVSCPATGSAPAIASLRVTWRRRKKPEIAPPPRPRAVAIATSPAHASRLISPVFRPGRRAPSLRRKPRTPIKSASRWSNRRAACTNVSTISKPRTGRAAMSRAACTQTFQSLYPAGPLRSEVDDAAQQAEASAKMNATMAWGKRQRCGPHVNAPRTRRANAPCPAVTRPNLNKYGLSGRRKNEAQSEAIKLDQACIEEEARQAAAQGRRGGGFGCRTRMCTRRSTLRSPALLC